MAKKKKPTVEEVVEVQEAESVADVDVDVIPPAEEPIAEDIPQAEQPEAMAEESVTELEAVPEAVAEDLPVEEASQEEAVAEVEALALEEIPDAVEEPALQKEAVEEAEALDLGAVEAIVDAPAPQEAPAQPEIEEVAAPVVAAAVIAPQGEEGEKDVKNKKETKVEEPVKEDAAVAAPVAGCGVAPDYNLRLMRRERNGYAGSFRLAEGEQVLSMYRALKGKGTGGRVYLTNERCLIESALHTEFPIQNVAGISTGKYSRLKVFKFLLGLAFIVVCIASILLALPNVLAKISPDFAATMSGVYEDMGWIRYILFVVGGILGLVGLIMACTSGVHRFVLTVFTEGVEQAFSVRSGVNKGDYNVYQPIAFGAPGKDYKAFISQVGSRLIEIKRAKSGK